MQVNIQKVILDMLTLIPPSRLGMVGPLRPDDSMSLVPLTNSKCTLPESLKGFDSPSISNASAHFPCRT